MTALIFLAACSGNAPAGVFRPASAPIYSSAVLDISRLAGRWQQVADFAAADAATCQPGGAGIDQEANGLKITARLCLAGKSTRVAGRLRPIGPGRFAVAGQQPWWVLWADTDYRTLVIGTPSGAFGFVLNRGGLLPEDRLRSAREVLAWNRYDLALLR